MLCRVALGAGIAALVDAHAAPAATGLQTEVVFSDYSPLSGTTQLVRRLLSPLASEQIKGVLARTPAPRRLLEQSIDLAAERFVLYVPPTPPAAGYGVLVFVPPWQDARLPQGWGPTLDRFGVIFVSAARSGNEEDVIGRREPLALLALYNVMQRYPVDPQRVYVGGFSGGSRIAMRLALGYPDVFRGALLNAGSDPLGTGVPPLPPAELFRHFQESMHLVYVTGENDPAHLDMDADSMHSMRKWCVFGTTALVARRSSHEVARTEALVDALHALATSAVAEPGRLAACRADIDGELARQLQRTEALLGAGKRAEAQKLLLDIDRRFGGLAAPRSIELQLALNCEPGQEGEGRLSCERAQMTAAPHGALVGRSRLPVR